MPLSYIEKSNFFKVLETLTSEFEVFVPRRSEKELHFEKFNHEKISEYTFAEYRTSQPPRSFFSQAKENVSAYFANKPRLHEKPRLIVGLKACDLKSFKVQDFVFADTALKDPTYTQRRDRAVIISSDCTAFKDVCYCVHLGDLPYPKIGFDLNLSEVRGGYILEGLTQTGNELLKKFESHLENVTQEHLTMRDRQREDLVNKLKNAVESSGMPTADTWQSLVIKGFNSGIWDKWAAFCVECGACTQSCPTCHCFLLYDAASGKSGFMRNRIWDSCQFYAFAKVAGGANPRSRLSARLRNRYDKKFNFFKDVLGLYACTGCGRCIEACLGKIDMREVFKDLARI
ncbi:MAG: 4Fe-4S dicluster domain-containing protein [Candidatus Omnitrophota bacterium]